MKLLSVVATAVCIATVASAEAAPVTVDFELASDLASVGTLYNASFGVNFSSTALGLVSTANGGNGNFENEPSPTTVLFVNGLTTTMNRSAGFFDSISFYYSGSGATTVSVFDDVDGLGALLATTGRLAPQNDTGCAVGALAFCNWDLFTLVFGGTAKSIVFSGLSPAGTSSTLYDSVSFNTAAVVVPVPEPMTIPLVLAALAGLVVTTRRKSA